MTTTSTVPTLPATLTRGALFIGGQWRRPTTDERITVISPMTEQPIGGAPDSDPRDVDAAVDAARAAVRGSGWGALQPAERADIMLRFADALESRADETAAIVTAENGMPTSLS